VRQTFARVAEKKKAKKKPRNKIYYGTAQMEPKPKENSNEKKKFFVCQANTKGSSIRMLAKIRCSQ